MRKINRLLYLIEETYVKENASLLKDGEFVFMKQRVVLALVCGFLSLIAFLLFKIAYWYVFAFVIMIFVYKLPLSLLKSYKSKYQVQVRQSFLIWILQLEALVLSNNISNSIKKSAKFCPSIIKEEVEILAKRVEKEPTNKEHYLKFLKEYQNMDMNEVMLSLYQFNFVKKEDLAYDFALIHSRIDNLKLHEQETQYKIQADNWGLVLMCCPILGMGWSMYFCVQLNEIIFNMI